MIERNEIESVWFIENNELKNANRVVTKLDYKGQEITILKSEREWIYTDLLIKAFSFFYKQKSLYKVQANLHKLYYFLGGRNGNKNNL